MDRVVQDHYDAVYRFCARRIGLARAADAAQDTFLTAQRAIRRFRGESSLRTWLLGIALNECRRAVRRGGHDPLPLAVDLACPTAQGELEFVERQALAAALARLSEDHRDVVILHELQGLTYEEVATVLGVPVGTVKSRLHHAFANLRKEMGRVNDDLKAYVDGELPPDAAERLQTALASDPALRAEADAIRSLSDRLRALPEVEPVGRAATLATLAALAHRRPLWRSWGPALAGCAAVLMVASGLMRGETGRGFLIEYPHEAAAQVEANIPSVRREAFVRFVHQRGGQVRRDGDGLRAFYPPSAHDELRRRFLLPDDLRWRPDGLKVGLAR